MWQIRVSDRIRVFSAREVPPIANTLYTDDIMTRALLINWRGIILPSDCIRVTYQISHHSTRKWQLKVCPEQILTGQVEEGVIGPILGRPPMFFVSAIVSSHITKCIRNVLHTVDHLIKKRW